MNAIVYLSIVADQVHSTNLHLSPDGDDYFQEDNAPIHGDIIVREWCEVQGRDFRHLPWHLP